MTKQNEILIEDMQNGDVVEFLGYTGQDDGDYMYAVGNKYNVQYDSFNLGPIDDGGKYCPNESIQHLYRFKLVERDGKPVNQSFTKDDLKDGMVVTFNSGLRGIVFGKMIERVFGETSDEGYTNSLIVLHSLNENLIPKGCHKDPLIKSYTINKVEYMGEVLYERPTKLKLTMNDIAAKFGVDVQQIEIEEE